ncbi:hypothetical protein PE067_00115 [Paracoccus sp. DMF-8]|uniref:hypothetical protein n=1 Tax=Paracoccus sp. DMF-8 TaxID=3019445 RepID=UPI0023E7811F|nr:hypothetical protein [Paracoccus sp. DMF-8]MDF3604700.1 hypothetical protein [Paracoccus sp. DMF-8]
MNMDLAITLALLSAAVAMFALNRPRAPCRGDPDADRPAPDRHRHAGRALSGFSDFNIC